MEYAKLLYKMIETSEGLKLSVCYTPLECCFIEVPSNGIPCLKKNKYATVTSEQVCSKQQ